MHFQWDCKLLIPPNTSDNYIWACEIAKIHMFLTLVQKSGTTEVAKHILYLLNIHSKYTQYIITTLVEVISEAAVQY